MDHSLYGVALEGMTGREILRAQLLFESVQFENILLRTCGDRIVDVEPFRPI